VKDDDGAGTERTSEETAFKERPNGPVAPRTREWVSIEEKVKMEVGQDVTGTKQTGFESATTEYGSVNPVFGLLIVIPTVLVGATVLTNQH
jgi:hypothetical protein